ncbi:helix-turn-helix domain-containing protein [Streptomyces sp. CBMA152]|uniref:helix-turn-helix domain-containing protein n=1 Tax=Streptomyces sp. CBMA152 TaxID=1896312 RepID=UPI001660A7FD|nr:helix-turn-helix domain-containing protein [Streptomyces sp. CBMA152]MBD0741672.1 hypothetical protein [Streptomyces sp. CBMA152]
MSKPMSNDTTATTVRPLHPVPEPQPLTGLTGAPAGVYTELVSLTEPATVAELALAAGLGRSTTGKALTTLEDHGLAVRSPGGHEGSRRTPDRWHPAPARAANKDGQNDQEPVNTQPEPSIANVPEPVASSAHSAVFPPDETALHDGGADAPAAPATGAPSQNVVHRNGDGSGEDAPHDENGNNALGDANPPALQTSAGKQAAPVGAISLPGGKKRLAPGALRHMVIKHLQAHPDEAFTATKISRVIEKSSGAIANCLVTLVKQQIAEQVSDTPRTYRLTAAETTTE